MKKYHNGFTLIELMITFAIVAILLTVLAGSFGSPSGVYGYIKSQDVSGRLESVTSAMPAGALVGTTPGASVFQASVMVKQGDGAYISFSTEDRQWAALVGEKAKGKCVTARIFPYAPWELGKAGTYHDGRLLLVKDC